MPDQTATLAAAKPPACLNLWASVLTPPSTGRGERASVVLHPSPRAAVLHLQAVLRAMVEDLAAKTEVQVADLTIDGAVAELIVEDLSKHTEWALQVVADDIERAMIDLFLTRATACRVEVLEGPLQEILATALKDPRLD